MADVEFWFEIASPYTYLSATRIDAEAKARAVSVTWRPFLLGPIFAAQGWDTSPFRLYPAKGRHMWRDAERRCAQKGVPFTTPTAELLEAFPLNTVPAARIAALGLESDWGKDFVLAVFRAEYVDHRDISDAAVLRDLLHPLVPDPEAALAEAQSPENKPKLRANTEQAIALGLFGSPSFIVSGELFWGDDRLEDALDWAKKTQSNEIG